VTSIVGFRGTSCRIRIIPQISDPRTVVRCVSTATSTQTIRLSNQRSATERCYAMVCGQKTSHVLYDMYPDQRDRSLESCERNNCRDPGIGRASIGSDVGDRQPKRRARNLELDVTGASASNDDNSRRSTSTYSDHMGRGDPRTGPLYIDCKTARGQ
jgi:hypothetical protein